MRLKTVISVCVLGSLWIAGCGGDDKKGGGGGGASYSDISSSIESPTGTLASDNAEAVADAFSKTSVAGGERIAQQSGSYDQACPSGGNISIDANSSTSVHADYNDCCYSAGCCLNGDYDFYYSGEQGSTYSYCASYDIEAACGEGAAGNYSISYSGCFGTDGTAYYVVEVAGDSFVVSGSYNSTTGGTLHIRGANGSFDCTYAADGSGSCSGDGTFSF